jgi:hypothetical protein
MLDLSEEKKEFIFERLDRYAVMKLPGRPSKYNGSIRALHILGRGTPPVRYIHSYEEIASLERTLSSNRCMLFRTPPRASTEPDPAAPAS